MKAAMTIAHYCNDSASTEWLAEMRAMETEGERTPAQHPDLIYFHGVIVTRETAAEAAADLEAA